MAFKQVLHFRPGGENSDWPLNRVRGAQAYIQQHLAVQSEIVPQTNLPDTKSGLADGYLLTFETSAMIDQDAQRRLTRQCKPDQTDYNQVVGEAMYRPVYADMLVNREYYQQNCSSCCAGEDHTWGEHCRYLVWFVVNKEAEAMPMSNERSRLLWEMERTWWIANVPSTIPWKDEYRHTW